jgi:hypothetical protein
VLRAMTCMACRTKASRMTGRRREKSPNWRLGKRHCTTMVGAGTRPASDTPWTERSTWYATGEKCDSNTAILSHCHALRAPLRPAAAGRTYR